MGILHTPGPESAGGTGVHGDRGWPPDIDLGLHPKGQAVQSCDQGTPQSRHPPGQSGRTLWDDSFSITVYHSLGPSLMFQSPGDSKLVPLLSPDAQSQSRTLAVDAVGHPLTLFLIIAAIPALPAG